MRRLIVVLALLAAACTVEREGSPAAAGAGVAGSTRPGTPRPAAPSGVATPPPPIPSVPPGLSEVAGADAAGFADGPGAGARFDHPAALVMGEDGATLYVADRGNHRVRQIDLGDPALAVSTVAGAGRGFADGPAAQVRFDEPAGLALAPGGSLFVADAGNRRIRRLVTGPSGAATTIAGTGAAGGDDGPGRAATFARPWALARNAGGSVYVTDVEGQTLRRIDNPLNGPTVATVAGNHGTAGDADGKGAEARFTAPTGLAVAPTGDLYVTEARACRLRRVSSSGEATTLVGAAGCGWADGALEAAQIGADAALAPVGGTGTFGMLLADPGNGKLRRVILAGGTGGRLSSYDAALAAPAGMAIAPDGSIYVADGNRIRRFKP